MHDQSSPVWAAFYRGCSFINVLLFLSEMKLLMFLPFKT